VLTVCLVSVLLCALVWFALESKAARIEEHEAATLLQQ
jgi:hypothetical protein